MKITLEPNGPFPPSDVIAANIRSILKAATVSVGSTMPTLNPGSSITVWFKSDTGEIKFYTGVNQVPFTLRNCVVAASAPASPIPGVQWLNTTDGSIYTWTGSAWASSETAVITAANQAARLGLPATTARGAIVKQQSDTTLWCLKPNGTPSNAADWEALGFYNISISNVQDLQTTLTSLSQSISLKADQSDFESLVQTVNFKAPKDSPEFTGTPTAPTPTTGNNSTRIATTAFVMQAISGLSGGSGGTAATWGNITGNLASQTDLRDALLGKQPSNTNLTNYAANPISAILTQLGDGFVISPNYFPDAIQHRYVTLTGTATDMATVPIDIPPRIDFSRIFEGYPRFDYVHNGEWWFIFHGAPGDSFEWFMGSSGNLWGANSLTDEWIPLDSQTGSISSTEVNVSGQFIGQLSKLGSEAPFNWYRWDGAAWERLYNEPPDAALTQANIQAAIGDLAGFQSFAGISSLTHPTDPSLDGLYVSPGLLLGGNPITVPRLILAGQEIGDVYTDNGLLTGYQWKFTNEGSGSYLTYDPPVGVTTIWVQEVGSPSYDGCVLIGESGTPGGTATVIVTTGVVPQYIGQTVRVGYAPPYKWYVADTLQSSGWREIMMTEAPRLTASKVVGTAAPGSGATARKELSLADAYGYAIVEADTGKSYMMLDGAIDPSLDESWTQVGDRDIKWSEIDKTGATADSINAAALDHTHPAIRLTEWLMGDSIFPTRIGAEYLPNALSDAGPPSEATDAGLLVSGTLTHSGGVPVVFPLLRLHHVEGGVGTYVAGPMVDGAFQYQAYRNGFDSKWHLSYVTPTVYHTWIGSGSGQASPDLVGSWTPPLNGSGSPTITPVSYPLNGRFAGQLYHDTLADEWYRWDGSAWDRLYDDQPATLVGSSIPSGTKAQGAITINGAIAHRAASVTIGSETYEFTGGAPTNATDVLYTGSDTSAAAAALATAINSANGYSAAAAARLYTATASGNVVTITAKTVGTAFNGTALSTTGAITVSGPTVESGSVAIPAKFIGQLYYSVISTIWYRWNGGAWIRLYDDPPTSLTASKEITGEPWTQNPALTLAEAQGFVFVNTTGGKSYMLKQGAAVTNLQASWLQVGDRDISWADVSKAGAVATDVGAVTRLSGMLVMTSPFGITHEHDGIILVAATDVTVSSLSSFVSGTRIFISPGENTITLPSNTVRDYRLNYVNSITPSDGMCELTHVNSWGWVISSLGVNLSGVSVAGTLPVSKGGTGATTTSTALTSLGAEPARTVATQAEMEAGTETAIRSMSPLRVKQAVTAASANNVISNPTGITGATQITNVVRITQTAYNALVNPDSNVTYIIIP